LSFEEKILDKDGTKLYLSRGVRARRKEIPLAPAKDHCCRSSKVVEMMFEILGEAPSNTYRLQ